MSEKVDGLLKTVGDDGQWHKEKLGTSDDWTLQIDGEVEEPLSLPIRELLALAPDFEEEMDINCVSAGKIITDKKTVIFGGVTLRTLLGLARPKPMPSGNTSTAPVVKFISRARPATGPRRLTDSHWTSLPLAACMDPRDKVMVADSINREPLPFANGGPLRSVVGPNHYFYKSIKWLDRIEVVHDELENCRGTWEDYGGYHNVGRYPGERFEPRLRRITSVETSDRNGNEKFDMTKLVPEAEWASVVDTAIKAGDLSDLVAAQLHRICDIRGMNLSNFTFCKGEYKAKLRGTKFTDCKIVGAQVAGANFSLSVFTGADLSGANMDGCDLEGAYLQGAVMRGASMRGATLTNATFTVDFASTDRVKDLVLEDAKNLDPLVRDWFGRNGARV